MEWIEKSMTPDLEVPIGRVMLCLKSAFACLLRDTPLVLNGGTSLGSPGRRLNADNRNGNCGGWPLMNTDNC